MTTSSGWPPARSASTCCRDRLTAPRSRDDRCQPDSHHERGRGATSRALSDGVRSDLGSRALYTSDASLYRILPGLVVAPADIDELARVVSICGETGTPLTMRGAGTSIAGNAIGTASWSPRGTWTASSDSTRERARRSWSLGSCWTTSTWLPPGTACALALTPRPTTAARSAA